MPIARTTDQRIEDAIREVAESFDADRRAAAQLKDILARYPRTTPAETWLALSILFWRGDLDPSVLRSMPYEEFLQTPYWLAVSEHVKKLQPWCALCPSSSPLAVHHRTYAHRGEEWRYLDDLTVLCEGCHTCHHKERK